MEPRTSTALGVRLPVLAPARAFAPSFARTSPAFAPLCRAAEALATYTDFPPVDDYARLLAPAGVTSASGAAIRFVEPPAASARRRPRSISELYDGLIFERGEVPTRARSWHDLFNALVWASFPRAKRELNARQYRALVARLPPRFTRLPGARTREQDALAMVDEGGVVLLCEARARGETEGAHATGDTPALRALVARGAVRVLVFGHALYEHLVSSAAPIRGRGLVLAAEGPIPAAGGARTALADALLAAVLARGGDFPGAATAPAVPLDLAWSPAPP